MIYVPFLNYADGSLDPSYAMFTDANTIPGLSDGGAVHSRLRRQRPQFLLPTTRCISQSSLPRHSCRLEFECPRFQCLVGVLEPELRPVEVALGQPRRHHLRGKQRPASQNTVGQGVQPVAQGPVLPPLPDS